ncbi:MAG: DNA polymerase III subunit delta [Bacteroidia bacterium]
MAQTFENIIQDLKNKVYSPVYLLQGDESYYIDVISDYIENNVLDEMEKEFNQTILYGKDVDLLSLISQAKRYPMMSNYQVVIVKEAQNLKNLVAKEKKSAKGEKEELNPMEVYLQNPVPSTLLVLCHKYGKVDGRSKVSKMFDKAGVVFESKKLYDNQVPAWVKQYCTAKKYKINERAAQLIAEYIGNDLSRVTNELDKLMINVPNTVEITPEHIEQNIGISKDFNVFELNDALNTKNVLKANRIVNYFASNPKNNPFVVTLGSLFSHFNKLIIYHSVGDKSKAASAMGVNPYFIKDYEIAARNYQLPKLVSIISILRDYDLKSKGMGSSGNVEDGELLKEMVFKMMH